MKKVRLGIIGCGGLANDSQLPAIRKLEDEGKLQITCTCDTILERAENSAALFGDNVKAFTDYRDMLDHVDAVSIVLPHDLHFECGMFFATHKKHILMEKPLCNTEEECIRLIDECEKQGVTLMCEYPIRYMPEILALKEALDSGKYGEAFHMSIWTEGRTDNERMIPGTAGYWQCTSRLGGGQFFSHGCHYVDMLLWFMGDPLEGAHFGTNLGTPWMIKEGTSTMSMKFKSGATAMHYGTWGAKGTKMGFQYQIFTTSGKVLVLTKNQVRVYYNAERWAKEDNDPNYVRDDGTFLKNAYKDDGKISKYEVVWQKQVLGPDIKNLHGVIAEFIDCIQTGREPFTSGRRALESLRAIWKMYRAEENHVIADLSDIVAPR